MHQLASATVANHLCQWPMLLMLYPRHAFTPTIADLQSPTVMLPHACASLSAPYHAYTPAVPFPYRYVSLPATPCLHSTILMLPHAHLIPSTSYHAYAPAAPYRYASPQHPMSALKYPYATTNLPHSSLCLP
ncbi:hypothetical protein O181_024076 [Austropuccinia psidii MF-1]|uniref:Uncharacterized protein n=1 Tax=Austropuccinia psidii MF-1 TaxID=1389203 RepID=A0A9Q3GY96_9BASI|nr:hypothetical protein [Austropuccinia psidii MF-1]